MGGWADGTLRGDLKRVRPSQGRCHRDPWNRTGCGSQASDNGHTGNDPGLTGGPANEQDQDQLTINVTAVNDTPTANAASGSGAEDAAPRIAITLSGADIDGDSLNFTIASLAAHGQLFATAVGLALDAGFLSQRLRRRLRLRRRPPSPKLPRRRRTPT